MRDMRIVKYNVDFCFREFKYEVGAVRIDLSDIDDMKGYVIARWSMPYAEEHLRKVIYEATGIKGGWTFPMISMIASKQDKDILIYTFTISSRLYRNLRRIYERP